MFCIFSLRCCLLVSTGAIDCMERFVSQMTCCAECDVKLLTDQLTNAAQKRGTKTVVIYISTGSLNVSVMCPHADAPHCLSGSAALAVTTSHSTHCTSRLRCDRQVRKVRRTSSIHVTTVSLMYGSTSVCRQKQSVEGRLLRSVVSRLVSTRSSLSSVRHGNARRHALLPVHASSSSSSSSLCWTVQSVDVISPSTSVSSRHSSDCSTVHIMSASYLVVPVVTIILSQFYVNAECSAACCMLCANNDVRDSDIHWCFPGYVQVPPAIAATTTAISALSLR